MKTSITTTTDSANGQPDAPKPRMRGWMWFVVLWAGGVIGAVTLGYAFKIFMNLTLFAVK
ncbi:MULTISPECIES: hypothetical protein [Burkholderia]|jgi:hypothetical protein|uniref:DUF2474 domain-containing protein n=2 Tax=Burkholderia contaminans TaxID=488447 RepID=A0A1E3FWN4_9BURK|nr:MULTISPECIES: hypothetical protein [Burkholderia]UTP24207.1 hypothetical protein NMB33_27140 [Burkholderia sp. FXe9]KKL31784.1 hypothetical protein WR31_29015 [Burkholderia contaminans LMG 23361]MBA9830045.1 hypothetical protein [Burkholderia contaminans]MBA9842371.1 hypothetical protein [Burkholderia contaminans]MBA9862658.1 hypothetical protein [Burkholderia contaminans]